MLFRSTSSKLLALIVLVLVLTLGILLVVVRRDDSEIRIDTFAAQSIVAGEEDEYEQIVLWIADQDLNEYGDPQGTIYAGGDPLLSRVDDARISLLEYLRKEHPNEPWSVYEVDEEIE